jgi:hypothetical protein
VLAGDELSRIFLLVTYRQQCARSGQQAQAHALCSCSAVSSFVLRQQL